MLYYKLDLLKINLCLVGTEDSLEAILINPTSSQLRKIEKESKLSKDGALGLAIGFLKNYQVHQSADVPPLNLSRYSERQRKVYNTLLKTKPGETISYGRLAESSGMPGAARFVGTTMRLNAFPIIIPCHRVILANHTLGNYTGGVEVKRILLDFEQIK